MKALEEKAFYPVGSEQIVRSNFRLISATCENLQEKIAKGEFRSDLYFRIEGYNLHLKSLKDRASDLPIILKYFQGHSERRFIFEPEAKNIFLMYSWPGNMREMAKVMDILQLKDDGKVTKVDLEKIFLPLPKINSPQSLDIDEVKKIGLSAYIQKIEMLIVSKTLTQNSDKVRKTLGDLKISNNSFYRILENIKQSGVSRV